MPTYEYVCTSCGHRFERVQSFSDAALTECPVCGCELRKVYGNVGIVLKGSGFYRTDSRGSSNGGGKLPSFGSHEAPDSALSKDSGSSKDSKDSSSSTESSTPKEASSSSSTSASTEKAASTSTSS